MVNLGEAAPALSPEAPMRAPRLAEWGPTPETSPGAEASCPTQRPKAADPRASRLRTKAAGSAGPCETEAQSCGLASRARPRPKAADQLINGLAAYEGPHLQLLPNSCALSPAGPTGSLGQRQNTQQRGAAELGETAFPGKTRPSRGLNYPTAAPRAPNI